MDSHNELSTKTIIKFTLVIPEIITSKYMILRYKYQFRYDNQ